MLSLQCFTYSRTVKRHCQETEKSDEEPDDESIDSPPSDKVVTLHREHKKRRSVIEHDNRVEKRRRISYSLGEERTKSKRLLCKEQVLEQSGSLHGAKDGVRARRNRRKSLPGDRPKTWNLLGGAHIFLQDKSPNTAPEEVRQHIPSSTFSNYDASIFKEFFDEEDFERASELLCSLKTPNCGNSLLRIFLLLLARSHEPSQKSSEPIQPAVSRGKDLDLSYKISEAALGLILMNSAEVRRL